MADNELKALLEKNQRTDEYLKAAINKRLSARDRIYGILEETFAERQEKSDKQLSKELSDNARTVEDTLGSIISQAKNGDLTQLKQAAIRLEQVQKVVNMSGLDPKEYERLNSHIMDMQRTIMTDVSNKNALFTKVRKVVSENAVDVSALLVGAAGNDPVAAFAVKFIGDKIKARRERKRQDREDIGAALSADAENLRAGVASGPTPETMAGAPGGFMPQDLGGMSAGDDGIGGSKVTSILENIYLFTEEISDDIKKLVRIAEDQQSQESRNRLSNAENSLESGLQRTRTGIAGSTGTSVDDNKTPGATIMNSILGGLAGGAGLTGAATLGGAAGGLAAGVAKYGLIGGVVATVLYGAYDILSSYLSTGKFGSSGTEKLLDWVDNKLIGVMSGLGEGAAMGASMAKEIPIIGPIIGGLFGMLIETMASIWDSGKIQSMIGSTIDSVVDGLSGFYDSFKMSIYNVLDGILSAINNDYLPTDEIRTGIRDMLGVDEITSRRMKRQQAKKMAMKKLNAPTVRTAEQLQQMSEQQASIGGRQEIREGRKNGLNTPGDRRRARQQAALASRSEASSLSRQPTNKKMSVKKEEAMALINQSMDEAGIVDPIERAALMAQTAHESGDFKWSKELGKDSYFDMYEPTTKKGQGLGNKFAGDGAKYKGRGFIQLTGRDNYEYYGKKLGIDLINHPELAEQPDIAAKLVVEYWKRKVKPNVKDFSNTTAVTKLINGGKNGLADRQQYFAKFSANPSLISSPRAPRGSSMPSASPSGSSLGTQLAKAQTSADQAIMTPVNNTTNNVLVKNGGASMGGNNGGTSKTGNPGTSTMNPSVARSMMS